MAKNHLGYSFVFRGFRKVLEEQYGSRAALLWEKANEHYAALKKAHPMISQDGKMMILPAAALYMAMKPHDPAHALPLLTAYGQRMGEKIARVIHSVTSIPGAPELLWHNMPALMRKMSSPEKGYSRCIVSETLELVGVDILACPLCDDASALGLPEVAQVVCAMDKAYMTGFRHIQYTRTTSVAEGAPCCDYRLRYDKNKK